MKVVYFLNCSGHGGDAKVALLVAKQQQKLGLDVQIIIEESEHSAGFIARATQEGLRAHEASTLRDDRKTPLPERIRAWRKVLYPYRNSLLHIHTGRPVVRTADVIASRLLPFNGRVATVHAPSDWNSYSNPERHKQTWRMAAKGLDVILCPSAFARGVQLEAGLPPTKVRVQHNPLEIERIKQGNRIVLRKELGLVDTDLLVLFLARLDTDKRPIDAIDAFSKLAKTYPRAFLAIAGTGELEEECRKRIQELEIERQVHLLGYRTDTSNLLKAADIYILPTKKESLSMSLLEALAAGLPIITTPVGGNLEIVQPNETAIITPVGDIAAISNALEQLLTNQKLRQAMGAQAHETAYRFSLNTIAQEHIALYQEFTSRQSIQLVQSGK